MNQFFNRYAIYPFILTPLVGRALRKFLPEDYKYNYNLDRAEERILKGEDKRENINKRIELIKSTPLKEFTVVSKEYDIMVSKLNRLNQAVSKITSSSDTRFDALINELKFTVLVKHLEKQSDSFAFDPVNLLHIGDWCGASTPVLETLEKQGGMTNEGMYKMSKICRMHDLRYSMAKNKLDIHKADLEMLGDILNEFTIKGIKEGIRTTIKSGIPVAEFKDYIINLLIDFTNNPIKSITSELMGQGLMANIAGGLRAIEYLRLQPGVPTLKSAVSDIMFVQERVLAILAFGAIGMKLLYDISIGKATNTVYGYEETRFNLDEIKYILDDINKLQNERLEEIGFEPVVLSDVLNYSENEIDSMADVVEEVEPIEELTDVLDVDEEAEIKKQIEYLESFNDEIYEL